MKTKQDYNNNNIPLVSISCITYQHAPYIRQCLDGFLMQKTDFAFEVLIHDDASTDGTAEIIKEYEAKYPDIIKPIYQTENQWVKGRRGSRTFNFPRAKGKYIALCEGDDYWTDPLKLQKQVDFLEGNEEYGMVYTSFNTVDEFGDNLILDFYNKSIFKSFSGDVFLELLKGNFILTLTTLFRKEIVMSEFNNKNYFFDYLLFLNAAGMSKVHFCDIKSGNYRINQNGAIRSRNEEYLKKKMRVLIYVSSLYLTRTYYKRNFIKHIQIIEKITERLIAIYFSNFDRRNIVSLFLKHKILLFLLPIASLKLLYFRVFGCANLAGTRS